MHVHIYIYIYVWDTDVNMCTEFELSGWDKVIIFNFSIHSNIFGPQPSSFIHGPHLAIGSFAQQVVSIWFYDCSVDTLICRVALFSAMAATWTEAYFMCMWQMEYETFATDLHFIVGILEQLL